MVGRTGGDPFKRDFRIIPWAGQPHCVVARLPAGIMLSQSLGTHTPAKAARKVDSSRALACRGDFAPQLYLGADARAQLPPENSSEEARPTRPRHENGEGATMAAVFEEAVAPLTDPPNKPPFSLRESIARRAACAEHARKRQRHRQRQWDRRRDRPLTRSQGTTTCKCRSTLRLASSLHRAATWRQARRSPCSRCAKCLHHASGLPR